ncbi:hypothetical protein Sme01_05680 [Sphaerisporangium melleum]|uniref:Uncharacterized protein n=1 Tax=Sphaerisporangium melleum TaxID=321316 RepID=A0A917VCU4_9ACTN|nr:hypothetical protein [Sphaerisporangium melleum]GGK63486.1 hypothetical protein GCM10007964_03250 [Sphaerisporangium melleum]GII68092.1 hypothetical protein Sme01_05680 [Sphaerisporangium melleum]
MSPNITRLYQAVLFDATAPISLRLRRTFGDWLVGQGHQAPDPGKPVQEYGEGGTRIRLERRADCGRYLVEEKRGGGVLRTRVTYHEPISGLAGWVLVTVEENGPTGAGHAPGFLPEYLRTARITDGAVHLTDAPDALDENDVPRLMHALTERGRRVPLVVVAHDQQDSGAAASRARHLAAATAGAAVVVRFADSHAERRFNNAAGPDLGVFGGSVRTYVAPFDPRTESYPFRHRLMSGSRLRSQGDQALDLVTEGIIGATLHQALPDVVQRSYRMVSRILAGNAQPGDIRAVLVPRPSAVDPKEELRRKMMALTVRPVPAAKPSDDSHRTSDPDDVPVPAGVPVSREKSEEPDRSLSEPSGVSGGAAALDVATLAKSVAAAVTGDLRGELVAALELAVKSSESGHLLRQMRVLGAHVNGLREVVLARERRTEPEGRSAVEALLATAGGESDGLSAEIELLRTEHGVLQSEYAEAMAKARTLERRVGWLEAKLAESAQSVYGIAVEEPVFEPAGLMDALYQARETLRHVEIGDTDAAATKLDLAYPTLAPVWAAKAWDAFRALDAFAEARSAGKFTGGFLQWCMSAAVETIPAGMVAMSESRTVNTNGRYSTHRIFEVPREVHPSGKVFMEAHIKLRKGGVPAPRVHFHDDSGGATGKVWVGYVGDHLPNTLTN